MLIFHKYILNRFLEIIANTGSDNAFCINEKYYTYTELAQNISKIRKAIKLSGYKNNNIGLVANDDIETYSSIFAIWLEGLAYVPIHPLYPIERSSEIIIQADIDLIINSVNNNSFSNVKTIISTCLEFDEFILKPEPAPDNALAYILFTSGSTGNPKGVPITRGNLGNFIKSFWEVGFNVDHNDRCLQCFDLTFDVSVQSFLIPLTRGACTYTIPHDQIKYSYVYGLLEEHHLTFVVFAPSMLRYLKPYFNEIVLPEVKYFIVTAEASPLELLLEWSKCIPHAEIYNFYGPTEATIYCTYYKFLSEGINKHLNGMLSIGKAMNGITAMIVDEEKNLLGPNQKGELCISGKQLTPGYWNNFEKNKLSFFKIKLKGIYHRFYKTGDLCYIDDEGDIMYSCRLDFQVKIHGFRIELGEIEYHVREYVNGKNAVAIAFENNSGNTELAMFVEDISVNKSSLIGYLGKKIPYYMIPTKFILLENFPLNSNGKIDRNVLRKSIIL